MTGWTLFFVLVGITYSVDRFFWLVEEVVEGQRRRRW